MRLAAARSMLFMLFTLTAALLAQTTPEAANDVSRQPDEGEVSNQLKQLTYRHIGPPGNRVSAVAGVPGEPRTYYLGAASGGIFKSDNGGVHWRPIFDGQKTASIGALAVAPSDPNVIWAGTGEAFIRSNVSIGDGIYKSTDGGKSWERMGLEKTGRIGRIAIHPTDPDTVFAAAMGHCYGPQQERGVYRTRDGGETWERVLFVDEHSGASDIVMDPNNPRILFAGIWPMLIRTWGRWSGGTEEGPLESGGIFSSRDGGQTWKRLEGNGLPDPPTGKIGLAISPRDSSRIYALIETNVNRDYAPLTDHQGELWRSDDGGQAWKLVNSDNTLTQRPLYYTRMAVSPDDADELHFMAVLHTRSKDGGASYERLRSGGDHHDMWIDPADPDRMIVGHDQGVSISNDRGKSWLRPHLPIAQMYHVATDSRIPYFVYGNRQDGPTARGPSNSLTGGDIPIGAWRPVGGCETGFAIPDPQDPDIVWSGCYDGILERYDHRTGHARNVSVWPDNPESWPAGQLKYRFQWTFPILISPHEHNRVYVGSQYLHRTLDDGQSWAVVSPDLTGNHQDKLLKTGGLTPDDAAPTYYSTLFALAESPLQPGQLWAGSNDGLVHFSRDGGGNWSDLTDRLPDLPEGGTISNIEPSRHEAGKVYLTVDRHQLGDTMPYVYKSSDYGNSWTSISSGIPLSVHSYAHCLREDPVRPGLLYLGTENALYASFDDGAGWEPLQSNLPHAPVHWLTIQPHFNDLVVATYGRGFWILDDVTPLQQMTDQVRESDLHLFEPRPAYRFRFKQGPFSRPGDSAAGKNPRFGASIHYWLKEAPEDEIRLEVRDSQGTLVRTLSSKKDEDAGDNRAALKKSAGLNRVYWDLRMERSRMVKLRTKPLEASKTPLPEKGWRPLTEASRVAPLAAPGSYQLTLIVGDRRLSASLEVRKDPNSAGTSEDLANQVRRLVEIRQEQSRVADLINEIEWTRRQLLDLKSLLQDRKPQGHEEVVESADAIGQELIELEGRFFDLRLTGGNAGQDSLRWPRRLYSKLASLARYIGGSDFAPTDQQIEVHEDYKRQLADASQAMDRLRSRVAEFNRILRDKNLQGIIAGEP